MPQQTKSIQISLWKRTLLNYWWKRVEKYLLFLKILAISIHSIMLQVLSAVKERSTFNHMTYIDWKWSSHYRVHSPYKGYLPIADTSAWSCGVHNSEVPLYFDLLLQVSPVTTLGKSCVQKRPEIGPDWPPKGCNLVPYIIASHLNSFTPLCGKLL